MLTKKMSSSSDTFTMGKNLASEGSSNESLQMYNTSSPSSSARKAKRRGTDLRVIRHYAKTHRVTLKDAVESIALSIMRVAQDNDSKPSTATEFDALRPPKVDLVWYMWRIVNDLNAMKEPILFKNDGSSVDLIKDAAPTASPGELRFDDSAMGRGLRCLLFALIYVDRMSLKSPNFRVNSKNVHRIILGAMYEAHKFSDDASFRLSHFALLGGVSTDELKRIEAAVCVALEFNFYISEAEFQAHSLAQLNFAVKGAFQRKIRQRIAAKTAVQQVVDKKAMSLEESEYGLGGSTPLMNAPRKTATTQRA